jgi:hypothetical protein
VDLRIVARDRDLVCVSDKRVDKVIGYAVRFDDGSWANLRSRRYTGSSPGRVFFLRAPAQGRGAASRSEDLGRVMHLTLAGTGGDVLVEPSDNFGAAELHGHAAFLDSASVDVRGGRVRIGWDGARDGDALLCRVPERCRLVVEAGGDAHFWIAAAVPELHAVLADDASLVCESVGDPDLELNGSGSAFVGRARGRGRVRANAAGSAIVAGGHLEALDAAVASTGSVVVHATVDEALLSNTGGGALSVPAIAQLSERHAGAGPLLAGGLVPVADEAWQSSG